MKQKHYFYVHVITINGTWFYTYQLQKTVFYI